MALGSPYNVGSKAQASGVSTTVVTAGTDANGDSTTIPAAGDSVFVLIGVASSTVTVSTVTDSKANTYTLATNGKFAPGNSEYCYVYECLNPGTHLASADTVTVTWSASTVAASNVRVIGCSGVASSGADDQSGTASVGTGPSITVTAGGTLAQSSELAVAIVQSGNATGGITTWGGGFTQMGSSLHSGTGSYFGVATLKTTSTTAPSATATFATAGNYGALLLTFKAASAAGLTITTASPLPAGQVGVAYTQQLAASGGITPYTWAVSSGAYQAGLTLSTGRKVTSGGDVTYAGLNAGPQGGPTITQLNAVNASFGPVGCTKFFFSSGGSGIYTGLLGGDINGGGTPTSPGAGTKGWAASGGAAGYTCAAITAAIPGIFILVNWGAKMSATAISNFVADIPHTVAEVGFCFQSEPESAYALSAGATFVADWTDQANKIRAAQANTPVKLTMITAHYQGHYQDGTLTNSSFIPPASVVDVCGLDLYDRAGFWVGPDFSTDHGWVVWSGFVKNMNRPIAFPEFGISGATAADQNTRIQNDWAYIKNAFGAGGTFSSYPLYMWNYWNTDGTSLSTTASSPSQPPAGQFNINQMLSTAAQQQWATIESNAGQTTVTSTGTGGVLSGTPTVASTVSPTVQVTDSVSATATAVLALTVSTANALAITTTTPLPGATASVAYTALLTATGGTAPYTWAVTAGALPAGLTLAGATGLISGTPTGTPGVSSFTVQVTDNVAATASLAVTLTVSSTVTITTTSLPPAQVGTAYTATLATSGGTPPVTWGLATGVLPDGISLDPVAGVLSGTPTTAALYPFTLQVTDAGNATATQSVSLLVNPSSGGLPPIGRRRFGGDASFWVMLISGGNFEPSPNATVQFYDAPAGGNQLTDLQTTGGAAIDSITTDGFGEGGEFLGPDRVTSMYADANGGQGPRRKIIANDLGDLDVILHDVISGGIPGGSGGGTINNNYTITGLAGAGLNATDPAFGAKGDGVADDTVAIQAALSASPQGGLVYLPAGTYKVSSPLTIPAGVWLVGEQGYRATASASKITCASAFTGAALLAFATGTPCGAAANLILDGTSLPAGSVNGVNCIDACKFGSLLGLNIGHFTGHGVNIATSGGNPDGWYLHEISSHDNGGDGVHWDYAVDGQMDVFHLDHNTGSGLALGSMNNCTFSNGKCQQNTNYGYGLTGGFVKSNATFTACLAENNLKDGWNFNAVAGAWGKIQLVGCSARDDGTSGTSGSGYAGFSFTVAHADILLVGCTSYITTSTNGPDFGLKLTNCTGNVSAAACSFIGSVAAYSNGGGNTLVRWTNSTVATGQDDATRTIRQAPANPAGFSPANPAGQASATLVMMGLGSTCTYTPAGSGKVMVNVTGVFNDTTAETGAIGARFGTGTAPANNAAVTGTRFGGATDPPIGVPAASRPVGFAFTDLVTGLTPGTAYWFDVAVSGPAGTVGVKNVAMTFDEKA